MKIAVLKERAAGERRVAISPETTKKLVEMGFAVYIEKNAGDASNMSDEDYRIAGAKISNIPLEIIADANIILKVQATPLDDNDELNESKLLPQGAIVIGLLSPFENKAIIQAYNKKNITSFALELLPRITRAQTMDVLSSQSNLAGYRAIIEASYEFGKAMPMMMTAAGTITPAKVLVLGAGVAGLQAIATARRLGAIVSAFDVRKIAKEQVESLGASFIEVPAEDSANFETSGGYAKEMSEEYKMKQQSLICEALKKSDMVICTALIPGKRAPMLINEEMFGYLRPGSVVVDLATASGGNCAYSKKDKVVCQKNVKIIGYSNMASRIAADSSKLYAKNLFNFLNLLYHKESRKIYLNFDDEIVKSSLITHEGAIINNAVKESYNHE
jgi:NAD(P) transhydrogenase subunit alpha